jgi:peptidoglycan hydrolase-like protein with peptidoglycan-binding domain
MKIKGLFVTTASLALGMTLISCSSNSMQSQAPLKATSPSIASPTPQPSNAPEAEFDLATISSACVKQFPGIKLSIDDEESKDPIVRGYIVDVQEILRLMYQTNFLAVDPGPADGVFGRMTDRAVRNYQAAMGITVDGLVGQETWLTFPKACEMIAMEVSDHSGLS